MAPSPGGSYMETSAGESRRKVGRIKHKGDINDNLTKTHIVDEKSTT